MLRKIKKTIGLIAPAFVPNEKRLVRGISYLEARGLKVRTGRSLNKVHGYFAGRDQERVADLHEMVADPEIDAIICARGGWGGLRMIDQIDYTLIRHNAKAIIGYSDVTTLQLAIWAKTGVPSLSGPMAAVEMGDGIDPFTEKHFWGQVENVNHEYVYNYSETSVFEIHPGIAEGRLLGGCLSLVSSLLGTPFFPDLNGAVLFVEDVGEKPYKIDRYMAHLHQAGVFDQVAGVILGDFLDCEAEKGERSLTLREIFDHYFAHRSYPVLLNFPYGHGRVKFTMPVGTNVRLDTTQTQLSLGNPFLNN